MSLFIGSPLDHIEPEATRQSVAFAWRGIAYSGVEHARPIEEVASQ